MTEHVPRCPSYDITLLFIVSILLQGIRKEQEVKAMCSVSPFRKGLTLHIALRNALKEIK